MPVKKSTSKQKPMTTPATITKGGEYLWSYQFLGDLSKAITSLPAGSPTRKRLQGGVEVFKHLYYARGRASGRGLKAKDFTTIQVVMKKGKKS